ncbi:uncharacterized protein [Lepeophtheirus salmonis]|uniref:uncharacterized protein isoform X2 n=1 Tax=Lepeophtheirus salmonis TaxID=72036 RepID=UPI003AF37AE7
MDSRTKHDSHTKIVQRPAVFDKLENLVCDMQDSEHGVPVRSQKLFLTSIPAAFMGYDLIEWLMDRLSIEDSLEAVHLANLLCQFGYYFPINELKNLLVKDDSSLYRFQTPYYWPSQNHTPDNIEYAIYLAKRSQHRNRQKHSLEDYEVEAYNNLKKILSSRWEFVTMQAEEQLKIAKDRKKGDKIITDSQEKAYWRVYRPPPGYTTVVESSPVPTREQRIKARSRTREHLREEAEFMKNYLAMSRAKVSVVAEGLLEYTEIFTEFDALLSPVGPSNPWVTDDQTYWCLNQPIVECPTEKRVKKWAIGLDYLVSDTLGLQELLNYMKKEYSHENLRFWMAVQELRMGPGSESSIKKKVKEIWEEFLSPGAKAEINIDGKTMEATREAMKNPSRFTFETTAGHVYTFLIKKDCYPRFIRSESYKTLLANAVNPGNQKKRFFNFGPVRKKISSVAPPGTGTGVGSCSTGRDSATKITLEDFNIHGATGEISDSPEGNEEPRKSSSSLPSATPHVSSTLPNTNTNTNTNTSTSSISNVSNKESSANWGDPAIEEESVSAEPPPPHRSRRDSRTTVIAGEEGTLLLIDGPPHAHAHASSPSSHSHSSPHSHSHPHSHPHHSHHHSHHHHHHHHHNNNPSPSSSNTSLTSKRAKSRSNKRKKSSRASNTKGPPYNMQGDVTSDMLSDMVLESKEDTSLLLPSPSSSPTAFTTNSSLDHATPQNLLVETSSKCTQTKSEDADYIFPTSASATPSRPPVTPPSSPRILNEDRMGEVLRVVNNEEDDNNKSNGENEDENSTNNKTTTTSNPCIETLLYSGPISPSPQEQCPPLFEPTATSTSENHPKSEGISKDEECISAKIITTAVALTTTEQLPSRPSLTSSKRILLEGNAASAESNPSNEEGASQNKNSTGVGAGEIEAWTTSSTEVCPWEDEKNCKDSHAPFVKTYATLGYL